MNATKNINGAHFIIFWVAASVNVAKSSKAALEFSLRCAVLLVFFYPHLLRLLRKSEYNKLKMGGKNNKQNVEHRIIHGVRCLNCIAWYCLLFCISSTSLFGCCLLKCFENLIGSKKQFITHKFIIYIDVIFWCSISFFGVCAIVVGSKLLLSSFFYYLFFQIFFLFSSVELFGLFLLCFAAYSVRVLPRWWWCHGTITEQVWKTECFHFSG